jgi:hypothetical protein
VRVIPILVDGATMPDAGELPSSLARIVHRHALELSPSRFEFDTNRLVRVLDRTVGEQRGQVKAGDGRRPARRWVPVSIAVAILVAGLGAAAAFSAGGGNDPGPRPARNRNDLRERRDDGAHQRHRRNADHAGPGQSISRFHPAPAEYRVPGRAETVGSGAGISAVQFAGLYRVHRDRRPGYRAGTCGVGPDHHASVGQGPYRTGWRRSGVRAGRVGEDGYHEACGARLLAAHGWGLGDRGDSTSRS